MPQTEKPADQKQGKTSKITSKQGVSSGSMSSVATGAKPTKKKPGKASPETRQSGVTSIAGSKMVLGAATGSKLQRVISSGSAKSGSSPGGDRKGSEISKPRPVKNANATLPAPRRMIEELAALKMPSKTDQRMQVLMDRNTEGELTEDGQLELESLVALSEHLSYLKTEAMILLRPRPE